MAVYLKVTPDSILHAARLIRAGELVVFPTETVYGLGANALDPFAVDKIFAAKKRPATSPLIVHVASVEMARSLVTNWPDTAAKLAASFWPGPLTLVLPKQSAIPDRVTAGLPTVGLRIPDHPIALELIRAAQVPIAAPSANEFTRLSPTAAPHVDLPGVALVLDGGPARVGIESTVLSLAGDRPKLLRPGMITREQIEAEIGPIDVIATKQNEGAHEAPGLHHRHYRPKAPLRWWDGHSTTGHILRITDLGLTPDEYAKNLYAALHEADRQHAAFIALEKPPASSEWAAIRDRLSRAVEED